MKSFDIFDTVLIRKCGSAENLYYLLACEIYKEDESLRDAFYYWRCHAENLAKKIFKREPSLFDIYSVCDKDSFKSINPNKVLLAELRLEKENLVPNQKVCSMMDECDDQIFISDMYLPSSFLAEILKSFGLLNNLHENNRIFISCEYNATKATGTLYDVVRQTLGIKTWTHYGDNIWSDVKLAKKKGLKAILVDSSYSKSERYYLNHISLLPNRKDYDVLISLQRAIRLSFDNNNHTAFAIDCIAPIYIGYVCHILQTARKRGITTLYFLSRDSYILYKIAQQYKKEYPDITLRYLFVSRKSLIYPCIYEGKADEICDLLGLESFKGERVKRIANYLQLDEHAFDNLRFNEIKSDKNVIAFEKALNNYCHTITKKSAKNRCVLLKYFRQEGLLDSGKKALVDVGWLGTSRYLINKILVKEGYEMVETFYLMNFFKVLPPSKGIYNSYLGECDFKSPAVPIVEVLYSASPYRSTLSYEEYNNKIFPIFNNSTKPAKSEIIKSNLIGVLKLLDNIKCFRTDYSEIFPLWSKLAMQCIINPQNIDITALSDLEDQDEIGQTKNLVHKLSFRELIHYIFSKETTSFSSYSVYYTNPRLAPYIVCFYNNYSFLIKKIKQLIKRIIKQ